MVSIDKIRAQFPALDQKVHGHQLVYLDNGATTHKPKQVIDAIDYYYSIQNSNIHRGVHFLSQQATDAYEASRETIRKHFNATHLHEIIFTKGNTEAINLVANGYSQILKKGDVLLTIEAMKMETSLNSEQEGKIKSIHVKAGSQIDAKDLLIELE